jgi:hypothetical protein
MMKHKSIAIAGLLLGAGLCLAARAAGDPPPVQGTWVLNNWVPGASVNLKLTRRVAGSTWEWGSDQPIADLHGMTRDQLHAPHASLSFTMDRDAGTFSFEGTLVLGVGRGEFRFTPNPAYAAKLGMLGYEPIGEDDLFGMAVRDISLAYAAEVKLSGLRDPAVSDLARLRDHGVPLAFIRELAAADYAKRLTADDVVRLRDHGVEGRFVRALKASGCSDLSTGDVIKLRDHGVDPAYVARIQSSGYEDLTVDQIIKLHDHGVD